MNGKLLELNFDDNDLDALHEMHLSGEGHKVIVIKKELVTQD